MPHSTEKLISGYCAFLVEIERVGHTPIDVFSIALTEDMKVHLHSAAGPIVPEYVAALIDVLESTLQTISSRKP